MMAGHPRYSSEEIGRRGEAIYEQRLRALVETDENIGKLLSIDIETGDYEIAAVGIEAAGRLLARHAEAAIYGMRIGFDAVYSFDDTLLGATSKS